MENDRIARVSESTSPFSNIDFAWKGSSKDAKELVEQYRLAFERTVLPYHQERNIVLVEETKTTSSQNT